MVPAQYQDLAAEVKTRGPDIGEAAPNLRVSSGSGVRPTPKKDAQGFLPWALPLLGSNQDSPDPESLPY